MRGLEAAVHALIRVRFGENGPSFDLVDQVLKGHPERGESVLTLGTTLDHNVEGGESK
jgi:hypothetical protein